MLLRAAVSSGPAINQARTSFSSLTSRGENPSVRDSQSASFHLSFLSLAVAMASEEGLHRAFVSSDCLVILACDQIVEDCINSACYVTPSEV